jgi:DMSO/TMAO reductase YedYZ molybdopterin-dependent catalytic subunit
MSTFVTRRRLITTGLAATGAAGLGVAYGLADRYGLVPPDHDGIYGVGETLTYAAHRLLMSGRPFAREFDRTEISKVARVNGAPPENDTYQRLLAGGFMEWRLTVDGLVAHPSAFSLTELKQYPSRSQITHQACEEGWSFIAEWTGVPLSYILNLVGVDPRAKYVIFFPIDTVFGIPGQPKDKIRWDSLDMAEAWHPQTLLAYGMNGRELPNGNGAPLRLRVPRQLGYKSVKYLSHIIVSDTVKNIGKGYGASGPEFGYSWYAGI